MTRQKIVVTLLVLSASAIAGPGRVTLVGRRALTEKALKLDRSCKESSDCLATGVTESWCPTMCGGCGFVINQKEKAAFAAIAKEAVPMAAQCPVGKCAPGRCEVACAKQACIGRTVQP